MGTGDAFHSLVSGTDYPVYIVTAQAGGQRSGCLVGFATQGSIHPARMVVMMSKVNHTFPIAERSDELVVHFLHTGNRDLADLFGEATGDDVDKFALCPWSYVDGVGPPVLEGTRGFAAGPVLGRFDAGDHVAHVVHVAEARADRAGPELTFQMVKGMKPGHPA